MGGREMWFRDYFDGAYEEAYSRHLIPAEQSRREAGRCLELLGAPRGGLVADIACGFGRHARVMGRRGWRVVAVDLNPSYVRTARAAAPGVLGLGADMRALPIAARSCDGAVILFNSFGYFGAREVWDYVRAGAVPPFQQQVWKLPAIFYERNLVSADFGKVATTPEHSPAGPTGPASLESLVADCDRANLQILEEAARILKPGRRLVLELSNPGEVVAAVRETPRRHMIGQGFEMQEEYEYDEPTRILHGRTSFHLKSLTRTSEYWVKLYPLSDLKRLCRKAGLTVTAAYGSMDGEAYNRHESPGLWIVAEKSVRRTAAPARLS